MRDSKSKSGTTEVTEITEVGESRAFGLNRLTEMIIGAAIEVHRNTGPGLMESVYEECLCYELSQLGLKFQRQVELPVSYKQIKLKCGFRMDLVVEDAVVVGKKVGLLISFNETVLRKGLKRLANVNLDPSEALPSVPSGFDFLKPLCLCASVVNN